MDFNLFSIEESCLPSDGAAPALEDFLGRQFEFFHGIGLRLRLPSGIDDFAPLGAQAEALRALNHWSRVFRYSNGAFDRHHILAALPGDSDFSYEIVTLDQGRSLKGKHSPVRVVEGLQLSRRQCEDWLIDLASTKFATREPRNIVLQRPPVLKARWPRLLWVGSHLIDRVDLTKTIKAVGEVFGVEVLQIDTRSFNATSADISGKLPLAGIYLTEDVSYRFGPAVVPAALTEDQIFLGTATTSDAAIAEFRAAIELISELDRETKSSEIPEDDRLLAAIVRPMLSHTKIGQYNHCQRTTVLKTVRARRMDLARADEILSANSEQYLETKESEKLILWKPHNDGDQYFLNPKMVERCRAIASGAK